MTIFGQSGGMKAADLMQILAADGLLHKWLIMSGVADVDLMPSCGGGGEQILDAMLAELGLTVPGKNPTDLLVLNRVMRQPSQKLVSLPKWNCLSRYPSQRSRNQP